MAIGGRSACMRSRHEAPRRIDRAYYRLRPTPIKVTPHSAQWKATGRRIAAPHDGQVLTNGSPDPAQNLSPGYPIAPHREQRAMPDALPPPARAGGFLRFIILSFGLPGREGASYRSTPRMYREVVTIE